MVDLFIPIPQEPEPSFFSAGLVFYLSSPPSCPSHLQFSTYTLPNTNPASHLQVGKPQLMIPTPAFFCHLLHHINISIKSIFHLMGLIRYFLSPFSTKNTWLAGLCPVLWKQSPFAVPRNKKRDRGVYSESAETPKEDRKWCQEEERGKNGWLQTGG